MVLSPAAREVELPNARSRQPYVAAALMVCALLIGLFVTPTATWYDHLNRPNYDAMIPESFAGWKSNRSQTGVVSPDELDSLKSVYSQIVTRSYKDVTTGRVVMLSVAYGERQYSGRQTHRPESCYSSQGFTVSDLHASQLSVDGTIVPVFRMTAESGSRHERVAYWIRMGNRLIVGSAYEQTLTRLDMNLHGKIADGLLFRVSELSPDSVDSDILLERFIGDLLAAVGPSQRAALIGGTLL